MNNSIPTIQNNSVDKFLNARVKDTNTRAFWMPAKKEDGEDKFYIGDVSKIFITPEEARKTNNTKIIGLSIAGATVLTAAAVFFLLKGGPKGISKGFRNLRNYLENKIMTSKLNTQTAPNKTLLYLLNMAEDAANRAEAVNNFTTFKDVLFKKIMGVTKITDGIHNKITEIFGKIGRQTVKQSYSSTAGKFKEIKALSGNLSNKLLAKNPNELVDIDGVVMTKTKWLEKIGVLNEEIAADLTANFSDGALFGRLKRMKTAVRDLYDKFKKMGVFWSKDTLTTFMAESALIEEKTAIQKLVRGYRKGISYSMNDMLASANSKILDISKVFGYKDSENISKLGTILGNLKSFVHGGGQDMVKKQQILDGIMALKKDAQILIKDNKITLQDADKFIAKFDDLYSGIDKFREGKVENILNIYKRILPEDEYDIVSKAYKDGVKSLDKSIKTETEDFMSKLRDLTLGSAPTDILTILASLGVLGYHLGKSKDADQRQSIALKYGFPALAGIGVSLFCNARLYAGSKSLLVGAVSTWILNRMGEWGDNKLKAYKSAKQPAEK
jgi:hypothetical protein